FGCMVTTLVFYYVPALTHDYSITIFAGALYGATLAGYIPLPAIVTSIAPQNKGAAMGAINLGAGASTWIGPGIVAIFLPLVNVVGVMWIFAALYAISGFMVLFFMKLPGGLEPEQREAMTERFGPLGHIGFEIEGSLLGHPPSLSNLEGENDIELILFDVGGTIYDDNANAQALLR